MTPQQFIAKWKPVTLTERSACQQHFLDLCDLLGQPKPVEADPDGAWYTFERGVKKTSGGDGWADVWMRGKFAWEYKGKRKDLAAAYKQLLNYREDLENPPLLVVCDMDRFEIHTNFTGTVKEVFAFDLDGLAEPKNLDVLRKLFTDPESLRPGQTAAGLTEKVARQFGEIADGMRQREVPAPDAAHYLMKLMFCLFAEDIELLPNKVFSRLVKNAKRDPQKLTASLRSLFAAMAKGGGFGADDILHFNGGLFADADVIDLTAKEIKTLEEVAEFDWSSIEPSIFGTLFERTLDPGKRAQIGAHYTSRADIETLLEPVMMVPLRREWETVKRQAAAQWEKVLAAAKKQKAGAKPSKARQQFERLYLDFLERLAHVTILDPACGSGNFLYVALHLLLDLEKEVITNAARAQVPALPQVRPTQLAGIEINPYAQQLAQVVIWIGYLQWMRDNGFSPPSNPVLEPIESIRNMDAILDLSNPAAPLEPEWPQAEFIVGNPPFLGSSLYRERGIPDPYVAALSKVFQLPGKSDLCCYWFEKSRRELKRNQKMRVGLLSTQAIRHGGARAVLDAICSDGEIFFALSDKEWVLDGASVRVALIGFGFPQTEQKLLDGKAVTAINPDLTAGVDVTQSRTISARLGQVFEGDQKGGSFDLSHDAALKMLLEPNPNGRPNSDVVVPRINAEELVKIRAETGWIIDFGVRDSEEEVSRYESPYEYLREHVMEMRQTHSEVRLRKFWWHHKRPRPDMRAAIQGLKRFLVTPRVGKHRIFAWLQAPMLPDSRLFVVANETAEFFGLLQSRVHELWSLRQGARHGVGDDPTYNNSNCYETFPFPEFSASQAKQLAAAAEELHLLRSNWLNPPELIETQTLEFPGSVDGPWRGFVVEPNAQGIGTVRYPRLVPRNAAAAETLKKRTLTNLYNQRPTWLDLAHKKLDEAVFAAYGWDPGLSDDELLARLLELNLEQAGA